MHKPKRKTRLTRKRVGRKMPPVPARDEDYWVRVTWQAMLFCKKSACFRRGKCLEAAGVCFMEHREEIAAMNRKYLAKRGIYGPPGSTLNPEARARLEAKYQPEKRAVPRRTNRT